MVSLSESGVSCLQAQMRDLVRWTLSLTHSSHRETHRHSWLCWFYWTWLKTTSEDTLIKFTFTPWRYASFKVGHRKMISCFYLCGWDFLLSLSTDVYFIHCLVTDHTDHKWNNNNSIKGMVSESFSSIVVIFYLLHRRYLAVSVIVFHAHLDKRTGSWQEDRSPAKAPLIPFADREICLNSL